MKKETREQLDLFRRQQEEAERKALEDENTDALKEKVRWAAPGRKRKKRPETGLLKGVKLRKSSSAAEDNIVVDATIEKEELTSGAPKTTNANPTATTTIIPATAHPEKALGTFSLELGYPSSDEDD